VACIKGADIEVWVDMTERSSQAWPHTSIESVGVDSELRTTFAALWRGVAQCCGPDVQFSCCLLLVTCVDCFRL
jgi:hypothetical protein